MLYAQIKLCYWSNEPCTRLCQTLSSLSPTNYVLDDLLFCFTNNGQVFFFLSFAFFYAPALQILTDSHLCECPGSAGAMATWRQSAQSRVHGGGATSFIIQLVLLLCGHLQDAQGQGKILFHHISPSKRPRTAKLVLQS